MTAYKQVTEAKNLAMSLLAKHALDGRRGIAGPDRWAVPLAEQYLAQAAELERVRAETLEEVALAVAEYSPSRILLEALLQGVERPLDHILSECGCLGPQAGETLCPCRLRAVEIAKPDSLYSKTKARWAALKKAE